jgi:hypothetical protein
MKAFSMKNSSENNPMYCLRKTAVSLLFLTLFSQLLFAQKIITYGIEANASSCWLSGKTPEQLAGFSKKGSYNVNFGITTQYYINKKNAIKSGFQFVSDKFSYDSQNYNVRFADTDSEGKNYERTVDGKDISEKTSFFTIQIPIILTHEFIINRNFRLFAEAGPTFAIPISGESNVAGIFTYKGYYADGNYTLEDIPLYGFSSDVAINRNQKQDYSFLYMQGSAAAGCLININRYWRFLIICKYQRSLTPIMKDQNGSFYISNKINEFNSILGSRSMGISSVSFGFSLQKAILF